MLRRFLPLVIIGICLNSTLCDVGANLSQGEGNNPQNAARNARPCGGYDQPICGSPEAAGMQQSINGVMRNSGYSHRMSYLQQPKPGSLVTPPIMVSADSLPAVAETKKALENFYSRMVQDYGGCTWQGDPAGYVCEEDAIVWKKLQAAFLRNGGAAIKGGYAPGYLDFAKGWPAYNLDGLHTTVNVNLYWLDLFSRGKATLAFQDNNFGLDTIKRFEEKERQEFDLMIDRRTRYDVLNFSIPTTCPDKACEDRRSALHEAAKRELELINQLPTGFAFTRTMLWANGPPIPGGKIYLYVQAVNGLILVEKLYQGVPMIVEVVFEEPLEAVQYPFVMEAGGTKLNLIAKPISSDKRVFQTEAFRVDPR